MKAKTKALLLEAKTFCDENDKSSEFMLQYMQDVAGVELDVVIKFLEGFTEETNKDTKAQEAVPNDITGEDIIAHHSFIASLAHTIASVRNNRTPDDPKVRYKRNAYDEAIDFKPEELLEEFIKICDKTCKLSAAVRTAIENIIIDAAVITRNIIKKERGL